MQSSPNGFNFRKTSSAKLDRRQRYFVILPLFFESFAKEERLQFCQKGFFGVPKRKESQSAKETNTIAAPIANRK